MRTTCSSVETKTLPSPILPVRAAASMASITRSTIASSTAASIFTLGRKSTTYSAPRYSSVCPFWRPKPLTSVTVTPCTPMALRASRTSSSLNGLTIAVTIFIAPPPLCLTKRAQRTRLEEAALVERSHGLADREDGPGLIDVGAEEVLVEASLAGTDDGAG